MKRSILTSKGQFTIPVDLRRELELHTGDRLNCVVEDGKLIVVPSRGSIRNLKGCIPNPKEPVSLEDMNAAVLDEAASQNSRLS